MQKRALLARVLVLFFEVLPTAIPAKSRKLDRVLERFRSVVDHCTHPSFCSSGATTALIMPKSTECARSVVRMLSSFSFMSVNP